MKAPKELSLPYMRNLAQTAQGRALIREQRPAVQRQRKEVAAALAECDRILQDMALALGEGLPA